MLTRVKTAAHLANFLFHAKWKRYDLDFLPADLDPKKFMSARQVADAIPDGAVCISSGMAGNARCSIFYFALRDSYEEKQQPKNLNWIAVSAQGGRGKLPGTIEELGAPGLLKSFICGHVETAKELTKRAEEGHIELHTMPQGEMTFLLQAQARGENTIETTTGIGTFIDPRVGTGSPVSQNPTTRYIRVPENNPDKLEFTLPKIDVAVFSAPYADKEGNIYYKDAAVITENTESALAAKKNGGKVFVSVGKIIEKNANEISLSKDNVDGIIFYPKNEQTASVFQKNHWPMFTRGANVDVDKAMKQVKFINKLIRATPKRGPVENALSRMAASLFTREAQKGNLINFGIGLPEEVGLLLYEGGLYPDLICSSETGVYHGLPLPGMFFGAAINPKEIYSSAWIFNHYRDNLDATVLGLMEVDGQGNVNVSKRSDAVSDYVGPGGFINISESAKTIIFIGSWMAKARMEIKDGKLKINKPGLVKFVQKLKQVTFNAQNALAAQKRVFYVTNVGIFKLTPKGLELIQVAPGIDIQKDIVDVSHAKIVLPESGKVDTVPENIMTGEGFALKWEN